MKVLEVLNLLLAPVKALIEDRSEPVPGAVVPPPVR
jgi:hypothetical protein